MASNNDLSPETVEVLLPITKPIIIESGLGLSGWKDYFNGKISQASFPKEKCHYTKCLKLLMWAEFCNGTLVYIGNAVHMNNQLSVRFRFSFLDEKCKNLFDFYWDDFLDAVVPS